eukprot:scpid105400/ scgid20067/ 
MALRKSLPGSPPLANAAETSHNTYCSTSNTVASVQKRSCEYCGGAAHPQRDCPATDKVCNHCQKHRHFHTVCHQRRCDKSQRSVGGVTSSTPTAPNSLAVREYDADMDSP